MSNSMVISGNNQATMSSREISELSGKRHDAVLRDIRRMFDKLEEDAHTFVGTYIDSLGREQSEYLLPRRECEILVTGYDVKRRAAVIDRWFDLESGNKAPVRTVAANDPLDQAEKLCGMLNLTGSSKLVAVGRFVRSSMPHLVPLLPDYAIDAPAVAGSAASSLATESATALLSKCDAGMCAARFNRLCEAAGILEKKSRKKKTGGMKSFWCVTEKGLDYGKNVTSEHSPLETQPHWYCDHFDALLALVEQEKAA
ncbi:Rha family transcriptional regulator [Halomonas sp. 86]|uniref:Rha family transcriptional regulator n=1 Tax=unclassified Halomonas TaxID=2609666 RepID=UPI0040348F52